MSFNGSGSFLINTAGQPVVSGTVISSTAFNALTADLATGLSTCITKDGQTTVTANIPMANYKFTGLGAGSGAADSANLSQVQSTVVKLLASVSGTDTITAVGSPTVAAYAAGQMFYFVAAGDNTGAVTINIDSLGAKAVTRDGSVALAAGDIKSGEVVVIVYDGTRFQVVSQLNSSGDARFANVSIASSLYVGGVATIVGNAGFSANVSIASALSVGGVATITGTVTGSKFVPTGNVTTGNGMYLPTTNTLAFSTNGAEVFRLDASGNAGLGVTPSAWAASEAIQFGTTSTTSYSFGKRGFANNTYFNGSDYKYYATGAATIYQASSGRHVWYSAASGTAGNTITFVEGMRLDESGNLGLGVTPSGWGTSGTVIKALQIGTAGFIGGGSGFNTFYSGSNCYFDGSNWKYTTTAAVSMYEQGAGAFKWFNATSGTAGNTITFGDAKMTLTAGGLLGVGSTSPDQLVTLNSASTSTNSLVSYKQNGTTYGYTGMGSDNRLRLDGVSVDVGVGTAASDKYVWFYTNNTERARITSGGDLLVGTTNNQGSGRISIIPTSGGDTCINTQDADTTYYVGLWYTSNTTLAGYISVSGNATSYVTSSDKRVKKNIVLAPDAGTKIDAMQVVSHDWKNDQGSSVEYGMIAQDLYEIAPQAVNAGDDGEEIEKVWGVDYSKLVPMLVKEIQSLRARVAALEGA